MAFDTLRSDILRRTGNFSRVFLSNSFTDCYVQFVAYTRTDYACVNVYRTSEKCFRVIWCHSHCQTEKFSEYKSFRSFSELCFYLDTLSYMLV